MTTFSEEQLKAGVGMALRNRDAAVNDAVTLAVELEGARSRIAELEAEVTRLKEENAALLVSD